MSRGTFRRTDFHVNTNTVMVWTALTVILEQFEAALDDIVRGPDLVNVALDVLYEADDVGVGRYPLP